jgi:phage gp36-like protein
MAYTTADDVRQVATPVTGNGRGGWSLEDVDVDHHIRDAQAEIDARLAQRYTVPFPDVDDVPATPEIIREICQDIAAYLCVLQANGGVPIPDDHPVRLRYERKHQFLLDLQAGDMDVPGEDGLDDGTFNLINVDRRCYRLRL